MASSVSSGSCRLPSHDLRKFNLNDYGNYNCDECKALISKPPNRALKCSSCNFSLHLSCLSPEPFITSSKHEHGLVLLLGEYAEPLRRRQCTLCKELCESMFYRCGTCNYNFHPNCVRDDDYYRTYFDCITYFMHTEHGLKLKKEQRKHGTCKLCQIEVEELRYQCKGSDCKFYMHPACTKFPQFMTHIVHPDPKHVLWLTNDDTVRCNINSCKSHHVGEWYYKCILCNFSRHPRCLATQVGGEQGPIQVGRKRTRQGTPSMVDKNKRIQTPANLGLRVIVQFAADKYNFPQALRNDIDQFLRRTLQL